VALAMGGATDNAVAAVESKDLDVAAGTLYGYGTLI